MNGTNEGARLAPEFKELVQRLWSRSTVDPNTGCWVFGGALDGKGYGRIRYGGRAWPAHRLAHLAFIGPIPDGLVVDHVYDRGCRSRACWNPDHLEAVTTAENNARIPGWVRESCPHGHPMTEENTVTQITRRGYVNRMCQTCRRAASRAAKKRAYWAEKGMAS